MVLWTKNRPPSRSIIEHVQASYAVRYITATVILIITIKNNKECVEGVSTNNFGSIVRDALRFNVCHPGDGR